tara:strand:+ start:636 stop:806 length:171 start_codon:yes stop_codon:yes gene_type:complete
MAGLLAYASSFRLPSQKIQWHLRLYSAFTVAGTALDYNSYEIPNSHFKLEEIFEAP